MLCCVSWYPMALFLELCSHILIPSVLLKRPVRWKMYLSNTCRFWTAALYGSRLETLLIWFQRELLQNVFCVVRPQEEDLSWTQWNAAFAIAMEPLVGTDIRISHVFVLELGTSSGGVPLMREGDSWMCVKRSRGQKLSDPQHPSDAVQSCWATSGNEWKSDSCLTILSPESVMVGARGLMYTSVHSVAVLWRSVL